MEVTNKIIKYIPVIVSRKTATKTTKTNRKNKKLIYQFFWCRKTFFWVGAHTEITLDTKDNIQEVIGTVKLQENPSKETINNHTAKQSTFLISHLDLVIFADMSVTL